MGGGGVCEECGGGGEGGRVGGDGVGGDEGGFVGFSYLVGVHGKVERIVDRVSVVDCTASDAQ